MTTGSLEQLETSLDPYYQELLETGQSVPLRSAARANDETAVRNVGAAGICQICRRLMFRANGNHTSTTCGLDDCRPAEVYCEDLADGTTWFPIADRYVVRRQTPTGPPGQIDRRRALTDGVRAVLGVAVSVLITVSKSGDKHHED